MLACDLVVASHAARLGVPEVKRSLVAGAGGALLLARRVPQAVALEAALVLAERIVGNGPLGVAASKEISRTASTGPRTRGPARFAEKRDPVWRGR